ncbi:MAG TPA: bifunctional tetrahydrofolate synthase/dihydrofolate synthase [Steroidobacteraceae bacterium]
MRTLAQWLELQESVHPKSIDLDLVRVASVADALGLRPVPYPVITVGGTNGKGSTVAHLVALCGALGVRTGAFTSPHLLRYNERIRIDGREADDAQLIAAFERIESARGATTLTFFEYNALAALLVFAAQGIKAAVLEVGLGGRLDATNIIDADVAVLTSVGMDHRDFLGDDLESIGREKAGIFRRGRPAVLGTAAMPDSVFAAITASGARARIAERDFMWRLDGARWSYAGGGQYTDLPPSALPGAIQYRNAATAIAALEALALPQRLDRALISNALEEVRLPGRFQILPGPVEWILDVAHNEPAARVLALHLAERPAAGRTWAVASILRDKDVAGIGAALAKQIDCWILCSLPGARGSRASELASRLAPVIAANAELTNSIAEGCALARAQARPGDRVLVFGSFPAVGSALEWLRLY